MRLKAYVTALHAALFAIVLAASPAGSGSMTLLGVGATSCTPGAAATNFLARTSGLSGTETTAYCNLINGLVADGTWTLFDVLYVLATNNTTTAALNLVSTSFGLTTTGSLTFTPDVGYTGDGSTGYLDTNWAPNTNGVNFTQVSASIGAYIQTNQVSADTSVIMGAAQTGSFTFLSPMNTGSVFTFNVNDNNFTGPANTTSKGAWIASRTATSQLDLYKNGITSPFGTSSSTGSVIPLNSLILFALRNNGTPGNFSASQASIFFAGAGLTATQAVNINNRINTYMTSLGHNVY